MYLFLDIYFYVFICIYLSVLNFITASYYDNHVIKTVLIKYQKVILCIIHIIYSNTFIIYFIIF